MYKWHVHSAIGRGRPVANDLSRVADGIAASLRQFSISASKCASDNSNGERPPLKITRSQRSAEAFKEASSLAPRSRGIDARSLAAQPPPSFTITRVDAGPALEYRGIGGRGGGISEFYRGRGERGGGTFMREGRGRGSGMGGRGGRGGRGALRARGRGRGRGGPVKKDRRPKQEDEEPEEPYNDEEKAYITGAECGWLTPYNPTTSAETLAQMGPPVISSARGINETLVYKMQVATGNTAGNYRHAGLHLGKLSRGNGLAMFESEEQKTVAQAFKRQKNKTVEGPFVQALGGKRKIGELDEKEKDLLTKTWVAGQYTAPMPAEKGDVLGQVDAFLRRNETYLPEDMRKLEAKLASLLPNIKPRPADTARAHA
ncbi:hypothetical protein G7Y89_g1403 [Cudoniella acicularis]|uniref:Uncharacterized protein n=1 Tax=Cudoniella acicularis TaxID=354080 RepID=A0A8H4W7F6_9HELO|nr:hypothetical protein G7Y89_g1403 [Cudoniella acicularis]